MLQYGSFNGPGDHVLNIYPTLLQIYAYSVETDWVICTYDVWLQIFYVVSI